LVVDRAATIAVMPAKAGIFFLTAANEGVGRPTSLGEEMPAFAGKTAMKHSVLKMGEHR
jgi:hypothetical protein